MNKYKYVAKDKDGKKLKGTFVAKNENEMKEMLLKAGYYVTSFSQVSSVDVSSFFSISGKVKTTELSNFCNQFSIMITAGISIVDAIEVSLDQATSKIMKNALNKIKEDLQQGVSLSDAMSKHPKVFPYFFSSMVYVGETAGCLDRVLITVAEYYELEHKTKKKVVSSLAYPAVLVVLLLGVIIMMMVFVIPTFIDSFSKMGTQMPGITMAIFNMSIFFRGYFLEVFGILAMIIVVLILIKFLPSVQLFYDKLKVSLPIMKQINMAIFTSRLCRSLGLLLSSGADALSALTTLRKTITNKYLAKKFDRVIDDVKMGMAISSAIASEMKLSPVLTQMIVVGEKTGELDKVLLKVAPYFDEQAERSLNLITTILQPTIMAILGAIVAILFVAMYAPILEAIKGVNSGA